MRPFTFSIGKTGTHYKKEGGTYLIEIKLHSVRQLFNSLDPSPFVEKDLDDEAVEYILDAVREFKRKTPLKLVLYLPLEGVYSDEASRLHESVSHYFLYRHEVVGKDLRFCLSDGRISLIIGSLFLIFCLLARETLLSHLPETTLREILSEGLLISGWVALWRPIQVFLYDWWPLARLRADLKKIAKMDVEIRPFP